MQKNLFGLCLTAGLLVAGCVTMGDVLAPPKVTVLDLKILQITPRSARFLGRIQIDNPNPVALNVQRVDFRLGAKNGGVFYQGQRLSLPLVHNQASQVLELPFAVPLATLQQAVKSQDRQDLKFEFSGKLFSNRPWPSFPRTFRLIQILPVPRPPEVGFAALGPPLANRQAALWLHVRNPNTFSIQVEQLSCRVDLGTAHWVVAASALAVRVPAGESAKLPFGLLTRHQRQPVPAENVPRDRDLNLRLQGEMVASSPFGDLILPIAERVTLASDRDQAP